jgi:hypothetical protein
MGGYLGAWFFQVANAAASTGVWRRFSFDWPLILGFCRKEAASDRKEVILAKYKIKCSEKQRLLSVVLPCGQSEKRLFLNLILRECYDV